MEVKRFIVRGKKGQDISCYKIVPPKVLGVVHIMHGMGEHKERYLDFAQFLAANSYAVYVHDHRKHGDSIQGVDEVGIFTKDDKWIDIINDCSFVNRKIRKELPDVKVITLGHSMGSIIARKFISLYPKASDLAIIMGTLPPIGLGKAAIPLLMTSVMSLFNPHNNRSLFMAKQLNEPLIKEFEPRRTDFDWITSDEEIVDKYVEDPLCGYPYSTRFYKEFFKGILDVNKSEVLFGTKEMPLLFISGKLDPVGEHGKGVKAIRELYSGHGFLDLTLELVEDARHEVLNEKNKAHTYQFIIDWIEKSIKKIETELD